MALVKTTDGSTPYPQWKIDRLSDFVAFLELYCKGDDVLFRGQAADWPLRPKLGRLRARRGQTLWDLEEQMLSHFQREVVAYLPSPPVSIWELSALAQHHGMATRLLDWTLNPLAALWFALDTRTATSAPNAVVWAFMPKVADIVDTINLAPRSVAKICYWKPRHISPRIRAQGSVFTVHPSDREFNNLQALQDAPEHHPRLVKILVPSSVSRDIRYQLDRCGINAAVVYPDLDGLARHIEWLYRAGYAATTHGGDIVVDSVEGPAGKTNYPTPDD